MIIPVRASGSYMDCIAGARGTFTCFQFDSVDLRPAVLALVQLIITIFYFFLDINECSSNPCLNNGVCRDRINDYYCACSEDYAGKNCETRRDD